MGILYLVGLGPGDAAQMTAACRDALDRADVIAGYPPYVDLVRGLYPQKATIETPMKGERQRCLSALEAANDGQCVAMVSSGDSGVYGMASLVYELSEPFPQVEIKNVAGITAALSGAAVLGAPLAHDFAVISLSDLLTPWTLIERRLRCASEADFCLALYNPASHKRSDYLARACDVLLAHKSPDTVCAAVHDIGRAGECNKIMSLAQLRDFQADMSVTIFIGNAQTRMINGKMVTPRGYAL
jgi:precorrin-3B C17-methyltransferase